MYTSRVARSRALRARHSVQNQWDLLEPLGIGPADPTAYPAEIPTDADAAARVEARLAPLAPPAAQLIVIHVSAGNPFRRWPLESFAELAAALVRGRPARRVVFTTGPSEQDALSRVIADAQARLSADERHRVLSCGDFTLAELRALVDRAALYVGGDSGPMHIASASTVPIVSLYGPTLPARSSPWRDPAHAAVAVERLDLACRPCDQRVCVHGDFRCLTGIASAEVAAAAERLLPLPRPPDTEAARPRDAARSDKIDGHTRGDE
jgi:ADP-heptose:LPS heptosyltransferase